MDLSDQGKGRRVQIAQQAIAKSRLGLDRVAYFAQVQFAPVGGLKDTEVVELVLVAREHLQPAEEVSLGIGIASAKGALRVFVGLHFFGDQADVLFRKCPGEPLPLILRGRQQIDLDERCNLGEAKPSRRLLKVFERDHVTVILEATAGGDDLLVRLNGPRGFQHDAIGGKHSGEVAKKEIARCS